MYADRSRRSKPSPASLAAAIAINAAMIAALITSAPKIFTAPDVPFTAYPVDADPPPPPPEPEKRVESKQPTPDPLPYTPPPIERALTPPDTMIGSVDPQPKVDVFQPPATGDPGSGTLPLDPPKPAPVLVDAKPDPRSVFQPDYPPAERRAGAEGAVTVRVLIGADGRVKAVEQVRAASPAFFEATRRQALNRWRFAPATRDGVPVESWRVMTVRFVLEG